MRVQKLAEQFHDLRERAGAAVGSGRGQRTVKWVRRAVTAAIVVAIAYQLSRIGWGEIAGNLPTSPLFFALLVFVYLSLPLFEVLIYAPLWRTRLRDTFLACALKRVYNEDLLGYSGEVYFYMWATRNGVEGGDAFRTVRDVNIVSAVTSMMAAVALVMVLVIIGVLDVASWFAGSAWVYWLGGIAVAAAAAVLVVVFRRYLFALRPAVAFRVFSIHLSRIAIANAAMIWMWAVAIPSVSLTVWITFATLLLVVNRLPLLPSKDLLFLGAGVELSRTMAVATAAVAGVFLVQSAATRVFNLAMLGAVRLAQGEEPEPAAPSVRDSAPV